MGILRRKRDAPAPDVGTLLLEGHDLIEQTARAHADRWGLGTANRWDLDQAEGVLRWSWPDHRVEAPAQILGTFSPAGGSWLWAWANGSFERSMCSASEAVRRWGLENDQPMLTAPELNVDEEQAADLAALGFRLSGSTGFYRASAGPSQVYMTFGQVTIIDAEGKQQAFVIDVG